MEKIILGLTRAIFILLASVKFLFVADLHFALKQYDWIVANSTACDLIVLGGDLLDLASALDIDTQIGVVEKYLHLLRKNAPVAVCSGNHDGDSRNAGDESVAQWLQDERGEGIYVDGDSFDLGGVRFSLFPWWDGPISRAQVEQQLEREAARKPARWAWIYHAPPTGTRTNWTGKKAIGDEFLHAWIERYQPEMVLGGHIHNAPFFPDGSWVDRIGRTWVFNPGRMIGAEPTSVIIDTEAMTAEWHSVTDRPKLVSLSGAPIA